MQNNYDNIAFAYDRLSRLVFGKAQVKAQTALLPYIPPNSRILIAGGGTGWILEDITKLHPAGLDIVYIEISEKMLRLSQKRATGANRISFIRSPIENTLLEGTFDVVITGFLFDNFSPAKGRQVFDLLHLHLNPTGLWLFTDFNAHPAETTRSHQAILKFMYLAFRILCNVEADHMMDMPPIFLQHGYTELFRTGVFKNFMLSMVYRNDVHPNSSGDK